MIMDQLMLRRNFYTTLDYYELKTRLKRRTGTNFKLGLIDNEQISLYYLKDWYTENGIDRVPLCQMEVRNKKEGDGRIRIRFTIATFALVIIAFVPVILMTLFYFTKALIPFYYYPLGLYPVLYFVLQVAITNQVDKFELDLRRIEAEILE
jgi:hypothetical protein